MTATLGKTLDLQWQNRTMTYVFKKNKSCVGNMHFFVPCEIDNVNEQIFSPLTWNNPLSKEVIGESYILMIDRNVDATNKHSLGVERVCNLSLFFLSPTWLPHGQICATGERAASLTWC